MRFVVFGGGGDMGSRAVTELAVTPGVQRITIVGRTSAPVEQARELALAAQAEAIPAPLAATAESDTNAAARSGGSGAAGESEAPGQALADIGVVVQDVNDSEAVQALMREHDVALGALGPFYLFEEPLVQAAIAARTDYVSLCDDGDATAAALKHDAAARAAGVTILTGLGWTPGITNVLAMHNAARLDEVTDVRIAWAGSASESTNGTAVVLHTMHIFDGDVVTFADGHHTEVRAGSEPEVIEFPPPLGAVRVCHVGHPEPVTLPERLPGVRRVALKGGVVEPALHMLAGLTGRLRLAGTHGRRQFWTNVLKPMIPLLSRFGPRKPRLSGVVVEVDGTLDGRKQTLRSAATAPMATLTAVPMAIGALWIAAGRIDRTGVFAPEAEGGPDPEAFLDELTRRGVHIEHRTV